MTKVGCFYCEYLCLHHHLFEAVALKEVKLHWVFSSTLLVGAAIDSVSCAYEWEVVWAQRLWVGREVPMQQFCDSVVVSTVLKKKKSIENPGFRELVQAWLLILASSCTLDTTLALQYSFKSWKTQCSPRHGYGFQCSSLQLCKRMLRRSDSTTPSIHIPGIFQGGSLCKSWLLSPSLSSRTFTSSV